MTKAHPRRHRSHEDELRDYARAEARRSGKSLGDWLDDAIRDEAADPDDVLSDDDRLEAAARRLARSERPARNRHPEDEPAGRWRDEPGEHEKTPRRRRQQPGADANYDPGRLSFFADAAALIERRVAESERQTARALDRLANRLEDRGREDADENLAELVERIGRIESRLSDHPAAGGVAPIRSALARLEARLERHSVGESAYDASAAQADARVPTRAKMASASPAALEKGLSQGEPLPRRPLVAAIAEIAGRQRALDDVFHTQNHAENHAQIEAQNQNHAQINSPAPSPAPSRVEEAESASVWPPQRFEALNAALEAISRQLEAARDCESERDEQQYAVVRQVGALRRDVEDMSRLVGELAPRASVEAVERALRDLARRVDAQRDRGVGEELLAPAERISSELRAVIKDLDPSPLVRHLHADIQTIGRRLDALQQPSGADAAEISRLFAQTGDIKDQLATLAARPLSLEKIETRLFDLTQRVDALSHAGGGGAKAAAALDMGELVRSIRSIVAAETTSNFDNFNRSLEALSGKLDAAAVSEGGQRLDELGALIAGLGKKLNSALDNPVHTPRFDEIGRKLEILETRLDPLAGDAIARIEKLLENPVASAPDVSTIEELVRSLDQKIESIAAAAARPDLSPFVETLTQRMNQALDPLADSASLKALETQIVTLSQRLDRNDDGAAALAGVEARIGALVAQLENAKSATGEATEEAVRRAAEGLLAAANPAPGALREALERELVDIRKLHDESGARTHETLLAVHETLERVVDRLAVFEDELSDIRSAEPVLPATPSTARLDKARAADAAARAQALEPGVDPRGDIETTPEEDLADFLVPVGSGRPNRREPDFDIAAPQARSGTAQPAQTDFIAAARRAAQQAARDAEAAEKAQNARRAARAAVPEKEERLSAPAEKRGGLSAALQARKRPLLLGLGALDSHRRGLSGHARRPPGRGERCAYRTFPQRGDPVRRRRPPRRARRRLENGSAAPGWRDQSARARGRAQAAARGSRSAAAAHGYAAARRKRAARSFTRRLHRRAPQSAFGARCDRCYQVIGAARQCGGAIRAGRALRRRPGSRPRRQSRGPVVREGRGAGRRPRAVPARLAL